MIVFLHGYLGHPTDWEQCLKYLNISSPTLCLTLPGHGHRPIVGSAYLTNLANEIANDISDIQKHKDIHFVGYSLGGRVGLKLYEILPEGFKSFTLISSSPGLMEPLATRQMSDAQWLREMEHDPKRFLKNWYSQKLFSDLTHEQVTELCLKRHDNDFAWLKHVFEQASPASNPDSWNIIRSLKVPGLYIAGEKDTKYVKIGTQVVDSQPLLRLRLVPSAGHSPHITQPEVTAQILRTFLNQI